MTETRSPYQAGNTPVQYVHPDDAEVKPILEEFDYSICDLARAYLRLQRITAELEKECHPLRCRLDAVMTS